MGCDIHLVVEVERAAGWSPSKMVSNDWYNKARPNEEPKEQAEEVWGDRNYNVFAILADVRNGRGFAGCDTGDGFVPICEQKGLPKNIHPKSLASLHGDHSGSWLTLHELQEYDWTQTTRLRGVTEESDYLEWRKKSVGAPSSYCGRVSGPNVINMTSQEYDAAETAFWPDRKTENKIYVAVEWVVSYREVAERFLDVVIPYLETYAAEVGGNPERVRIAFNFDS